MSSSGATENFYTALISKGLTAFPSGILPY